MHYTNQLDNHYCIFKSSGRKPNTHISYKGGCAVERHDYLLVMVYHEHTQKHLRCTMEGPASSYSSLLIHICWKVEREAKIEPPIQTEYLRSGGAII